jgi:hypothetical protein
MPVLAVAEASLSRFGADEFSLWSAENACDHSVEAPRDQPRRHSGRRVLMRDLQASELGFVYGAGGSSKCAPKPPKCGKGGSTNKHSTKKHSSKGHSTRGKKCR